MKKFMLGILMIIPIIIMLIVGLVTSFVSTATHIGVESVNFDKEVLTLMFSELPKDTEGRAIVDMDDYIGVEILPERANEYDPEWAITGEVDSSSGGTAYMVDDNHEECDMNNTGVVAITGYCIFRIQFTAENYSDTCVVEVTDADVQSVTVSGKDKLRTGEKALLSAAYVPTSALVTEGRWTSDDEDVAVVDANGVVTAVGEGSAEIVMYAKRNGTGEEVASKPFTVTVTAGASRYGEVVYTASRTVDLGAAGIDGAKATVTSGGKIAGGGYTLEMTADETVLQTANGKVSFILCSADEIVIRNEEVFAYDEADPETYALGIGEIPLTLTADWLADIGGADEAPAVTWSSSDENIAQIDENGVVTAVSEGEVVLTATYAAAQGVSGQSASVRIMVVEKVSYFRLSLDQTTLEVGLAKETVFASYTFDDSVELTPDNYNLGSNFYIANTHEITVALPTPPEGEGAESFYEKFVFSSESDLVGFDNTLADGVANNIMTFNPEKVKEAVDADIAAGGDGKVQVEISVRARYPRMSDLPAQSVVLTVTHGVEVNDANELAVAARSTQPWDRVYAYTDSDNDKYWSYYPRTGTGGEADFDGAIVFGSDIAWSTEDGTPLATAMSKDIVRLNNYNREGTPLYEIDVCADIYGNNHRLYAYKAYMTNRDGVLVTVRKDGGVVSNLTISLSNDIGDTITDVDGAEGLEGYALHIRSADPNWEFCNDDLTTATVEYCILQNASSGIGLHGVDAYINGCIVRNTAGTGIYVPTNMEEGVAEYAWKKDGGYINAYIFGGSCEYDGKSYTFEGVYDEGDVKYSDVHIHNVVMSNLVGTGGNFAFSKFTQSDEERANADELTAQAVAKGRVSSLTVTGFLDIYNWQTTDALSLINADSAGVPEFLLKMVMSAVAGSLNADQFDGFVKMYDGNQYVHFGFITTGMKEKSYFEFNDSRFGEISTADMDGINAIQFDGLVDFMNCPLRAFCYTVNETEILPGSTYTVNTRFINRLHS